MKVSRHKNNEVKYKNVKIMSEESNKVLHITKVIVG